MKFAKPVTAIAHQIPLSKSFIGDRGSPILNRKKNSDLMVIKKVKATLLSEH